MDKRILMFLVLGIFMISFVSAFDFDNVKIYDEETTTTIIKNCDFWLGVCLNQGDDIAEITLNTPHRNEVPIGYQKIAEITLDSKQIEYLNVLSKMELIDLKENKGLERQIDYKYLTTRQVEFENQRIIYDDKEKNISHIEYFTDYYEEEYWENFDFRNVEKGVYTIGLFMQINYMDEIEWIPTFFGVEIEEWAIVIQSSGTETTDGDYTVETFTSNGYFNVTGDTLNVSVLVIGGGGGGGHHTGGGGGAGDFVYDVEHDITVGNYVVVVGTGGDGATDKVGGNGTTSSFDTKTAIGGGGGGGYDGGYDYALAGASGGGGTSSDTGHEVGATATGINGNDGGDGDGDPNWNGGGGGGSGSVGGNAGAGTGSGGTGTSNSINGTSTAYTCGGGGGAQTGGDGGTVSCGGGEGGDDTSGVTGTSAIDGTGSGGGGGGANGGDGGDGGDGVVIIRYLTADLISTPTVTLETPNNYTNFTTNEVDFECLPVDDVNDIVNVSLYLDGVLNDTNTDGLNNTSAWFNEFLSEGEHNWTCDVYSNISKTFTAEIFLLDIDTINPVVSTSNLTDLVAYPLPTNSSWQYNATDLNIDSCYYNTSDQAGYNITTCNSTVTDLEWTTSGNKTIQFCANDTFARETCNTEYIWVYSVTETQADNPDPTGEGSAVVFNFTVNLTDIATTTATLMFNGTIQTPTTTTAGTNGYYFTKTFVIPDGYGNTTGFTNDWYWNYTIAGVTTNKSTTTTNLTVYELAVDNCASYTQEILNLSLRDEEGNSVIDPYVYNTTVEVEINLTSIVDPSIFFEYSYTFSNETNPQLCVPFNLINETNYTADITVGFDSTDHVWEFWYLDDGIVSIAGNFNDYTDTNVNLMDLLTADSTSFLFNFYDANGLAVDGSITHVFRKYIGEGEFLEVERSQADENGDTIVHLVEEDVIYYFEISLAGVILYTSSTYTALCQAVPCTINIEEGGESAVFDTDYDLIDGGGYTINESRSGRQVSLVYDVDEVATMNFTLYKYEEDGEKIQIDTKEDTGLSGVVTLDIPLVAGNVSFFASVVKDDVFINSEWVDFESQAINSFGTMLAIFMGALLILCLGLMAISTGAGVLIWVMVGLFVAGALGLFSTALSTGVSIVTYLIVAGALLLWKITGGRK